MIPDYVYHVDGAYIQEEKQHDSSNDNSLSSVWDTSLVYVMDNFVSETLRADLLDVVRCGSTTNDDDNQWDDIKNGPDPTRWVRGGLIDTPDDDDDKAKEAAGCWGLTDDALFDLCFESHDSMKEMEDQLGKLFADFHVSRLPESFLGAETTPITANAPTLGDTFALHIDGDPCMAPPSPWTDIYGRYPNRCKGKPRFVSVLVYLNDEWDAQNWGACTEFVDVATNTTTAIEPIPGRCVIMDQDVTHTVTAPTIPNRPRYSIVWKLVLHPKTINQDMRNVTCGRTWPETILIGSANES